MLTPRHHEIRPNFSPNFVVTVAVTGTVKRVFWGVFDLFRPKYAGFRDCLRYSSNPILTSRAPPSK